MAASTRDPDSEGALPLSAGPYERACQVAWYFQQAKPKSKVLILDANEDVVSKKGLFMKAWNGQFKGLVEYRNNQEIQDVDAKTTTLKMSFGDDVKADVLNVLPPMRAGNIATQNGLNNSNKRWCQIDWLTYESTAVKNVHILGDALQIAPAMPKSGHMANQHAKVCAAAVIALFDRRRGQRHANGGQHLLQLHRRQECCARRLGASLRCRAEDDGDGGWLRWFVGRCQSHRRHLCQQLGAQHLG